MKRLHVCNVHMYVCICMYEYIHAADIIYNYVQTVQYIYIPVTRPVLIISPRRLRLLIPMHSRNFKIERRLNGDVLSTLGRKSESEIGMADLTVRIARCFMKSRQTSSRCCLAVAGSIAQHNEAETPLTHPPVATVVHFLPYCSCMPCDLFPFVKLFRF